MLSLSTGCVLSGRRFMEGQSPRGGHNLPSMFEGTGYPQFELSAPHNLRVGLVC